MINILYKEKVEALYLCHEFKLDCAGILSLETLDIDILKCQNSRSGWS